jgi:predicted transcriptional regulator
MHIWFLYNQQNVKAMKKSSDSRGDIHKDVILRIIKDKSLEYWPGRGVKGNEMVKSIRLRRQTVNDHLRKLVEDRKIKKIGRGRYLPANSMTMRTSITLQDVFLFKLHRRP